MKDVLRKGKVLCIILQKQLDDASSSSKKNGRERKRKRQQLAAVSGQENMGITGTESTLYLSLHMGMTGRISSPNNVPGLESLSGNDSYPPPHTHLIIRCNGKEAAFSDPRRFGSVLVDVGDNDATTWSYDSIPTFQDIAPDALQMSEAYCNMLKSTNITLNPDSEQPTIIEQLANKKKGIKGLLLDQRAVVSGIGNWVADELLYRSCIHPDQSYLTTDEAHALLKEIQYVLTTAISCSKNGVDYPQEWLFHRRWRNGGGKGHDNAKDFDGKSISFVQSGGRSTAVVPSRQKPKARKRVCQTKTKKSINNNECAGATLSNGEVHRNEKLGPQRNHER
jgi:formamidopyrimidine-DNA glycosylase